MNIEQKPKELLVQINYTFMQIANVERSVSSHAMVDHFQHLTEVSLEDKYKALQKYFVDDESYPSLLVQVYLWVLLSKNLLQPLTPALEAIKPEMLETIRFNQQMVSLLDWSVEQNTTTPIFSKLFHTVQERKQAEQQIETFWQQLDSTMSFIQDIVVFPKTFEEFVVMISGIEMNRLIMTCIYNQRLGNAHYQMPVFK